LTRPIRRNFRLLETAAKWNTSSQEKSDVFERDKEYDNDDSEAVE